MSKRRSNLGGQRCRRSKDDPSTPAQRPPNATAVSAFLGGPRVLEDHYCVLRNVAWYQLYIPVEHVYQLRVGEPVYKGVFEMYTVRTSDGGPSCPLLNPDALPIGDIRTLTVTDATARKAGGVQLPAYRCFNAQEHKYPTR